MTEKKTVTFKDLLKENKNFNITYAMENGVALNTTLNKPEEVVKFIAENIYNMKLLTINDVIIDIDKLIEKYSR